MLIVLIGLYQSIYSTMIILRKFGRSCELLRKWRHNCSNFVNIIFLTILWCHGSCSCYYSCWGRDFGLWLCTITILNHVSIRVCSDWAATWIRWRTGVGNSSRIIYLGFADRIGHLIPQAVLVPRVWCRGGLFVIHIWISWKQIFLIQLINYAVRLSLIK